MVLQQFNLFNNHNVLSNCIVVNNPVQERTREFLKLLEESCSLTWRIFMRVGTGFPLLRKKDMR